MSRTYRRKNCANSHFWQFEREVQTYFDYKTRDWARVDPKSEEYERRKAIFHSDNGTNSFKEPGPAWFRNMFSERPHRRMAKRELKKFMNDPDYEVILEPKGWLRYWT